MRRMIAFGIEFAGIPDGEAFFIFKAGHFRDNNIKTEIQ